MRAPSNPILSVIATVGIAVAGCASQPKQDQSSRAVNEPACAEDPSNPLHLTTLRKTEAPRDPQLESLLNQGGSPRLQQINREMYQSLRSLDAELRREQQVAACQRGAADILPLQARTTPDVAGASNAGATVNAETSLPAASSAGLAGTGATAANARMALVRKASVPPTTTGGSGNGAVAQKVSAGSDNDIVARRLRKAAEQETDPTLKAKLWKEYAQYQQGNGGK
jgi:hypothetical protein